MSWVQTGSTICFKPYSLEEALHGLSAAGFENVDCFWKDLRHALYGGSA